MLAQVFEPILLEDAIEIALRFIYFVAPNVPELR